MYAASSGLNQSGLLLYNNVLALPVMALFLVLGTNELNDVRSFPYLTSPTFWLFLLVSCSQAFVLNLAIFW